MVCAKSAKCVMACVCNIAIDFCLLKNIIMLHRKVLAIDFCSNLVAEISGDLWPMLAHLDTFSTSHTLYE